MAYPSLCQRITVLAVFLDKLSKSSHPYDRLCGKLFGMSGEKLISTSTLRQHLKFREFLMKMLRIGTARLTRKVHERDHQRLHDQLQAGEGPPRREVF